MINDINKVKENLIIYFRAKYKTLRTLKFSDKTEEEKEFNKMIIKISTMENYLINGPYDDEDYVTVSFIYGGGKSYCIDDIPLFVIEESSSEELQKKTANYTIKEFLSYLKWKLYYLKTDFPIELINDKINELEKYLETPNNVVIDPSTCEYNVDTIIRNIKIRHEHVELHYHKLLSKVKENFILNTFDPSDTLLDNIIKDELEHSYCVNIISDCFNCVTRNKEWIRVPMYLGCVNTKQIIELSYGYFTSTMHDLINKWKAYINEVEELENYIDELGGELSDI